MMADTRRPSHAEIVMIATQAIIGTNPVQQALVRALLAYLEITGAYVRSGMSAPVMQDAFDGGVASIRAAASGDDEEAIALAAEIMGRHC
jgi:hypothetical protein